MNYKLIKHDSKNMKARVLYLSHDGLLEHLSQSQVWQYLRNLAKSHEITLVTYEKKEDWQVLSRKDALIEEARSAGVRWLPLRYHKYPKIMASGYDLALCFLVSTYLTLRYRIQIIHARNAPFTLVAMVLKKLFGTRFIFDMRGFWADERVDGGLWGKNSLVYKINKWLERHYFLQADTVVVLTHAAVREIEKFEYLKGHRIHIDIIPTCTNLDLFRRRESDAPRTNNGFILGYLGNVGTWYLFDPVLTYFSLLQQFRPDAKMLFINDGQHEYIHSRLKAFNIPDSCVEIKTIPFNRSPEEICKMDAAIFFIKPVFSKKSSMPTKLGELFGCGVPCLTNSGIGDIDEIVEKERVGIIMRDFSQVEMSKAVTKLLDLVADPEVSKRCVETAKKYFSLQDGIAVYDRIYKQLSG